MRDDSRTRGLFRTFSIPFSWNVESLHADSIRARCSALRQRTRFLPLSNLISIEYALQRTSETRDRPNIAGEKQPSTLIEESRAARARIGWPGGNPARFCPKKLSIEAEHRGNRSFRSFLSRGSARREGATGTTIPTPPRVSQTALNRAPQRLAGADKRQRLFPKLAQRVTCNKARARTASTRACGIRVACNPFRVSPFSRRRYKGAAPPDRRVLAIARCERGKDSRRARERERKRERQTDRERATLGK